jgi:hypothetical protein
VIEFSANDKQKERRKFRASDLHCKGNLKLHSETETPDVAAKRFPGKTLLLNGLLSALLSNFSDFH